MGTVTWVSGFIALIFVISISNQQECTSSPSLTDLVFILDSSSSITQRDFTHILQFVKTVIKKAEIANDTVRVGVITNGKRTKVRLKLGQFARKNSMITAVEQIPFEPMTSKLVRTFRIMKKSMFVRPNDRPNAKNIAVLVTGHVADLSAKKTANVALKLSKSGIEMYAVGVGLPNPNILSKIVSTNRSLSVADFGSLNTLSESLSRQLCLGSQVSAQYSPAGNGKLDLVFLIHYSSRTSQQDFQRLIQFLQYIVQQLDVSSGAVRVGAVVYGTSGFLQFTLNKYSTARDIQNALSKMSFSYRSNKSNWNSAFTVVSRRLFKANKGDRADAKNVLMIITDSDTNAKKRKALSQAAGIKRSGTTISVVGINQDRTSALNGLVSTPVQDNTFYTSNFNGLSALRGGITSRLFQDFSTDDKDIVIMLDVSTSLTNTNFERVIVFLIKFLSELDVDSGAIRVGLLTYSTMSHIEFNLKSHRTKQSLLKAVTKVQYTGGSTNTADALRVMRTKMFRKRRGDRPSAKNFALLITDGISNIQQHQILHQAHRVHQSGITVIGIGIGLTDTQELVQVVSKPVWEHRITINTFHELDTIRNTLLDKLGLVQSTLQSQERASVRSSPEGNPMLDVLFAYHMSPYSTDRDHQHLKDFMKSVVQNAKIDSGDVRVAVMTYSWKPEVIYALDKFGTQKEVISAIDVIGSHYKSKYVHTAAALEEVLGRVFTRQEGSRQKAAHVVYFIMDAHSNIDQGRIPGVARMLEEAEIIVYAIGIGSADLQELQSIAHKNGNHYVQQIEGYHQLKTIQQPLTSRVYALRNVEEKNQRPPTEDLILECTNASADIVFLLDASSSVTELNFQLQLAFVQDFLNTADIDSGAVRVGVMTFSTEVYIQFQLNEFYKKAALMTAIANIPYNYGSTNIADALRVARETMFMAHYGDRHDVPNFIIMLTDGVSNINAPRTVPEADISRAKDIIVYGIGIGLTDTRELNGIVNKPTEEHQFLIDDFPNLEDIDALVFNSMCRHQVHNPIPPAPLPRACSTSSADIVIMLDSSTSVTEGHFRELLMFVQDFIRPADIDNGNVRVGLVTYSTDVYIQFHLYQHKTKESLLNAIANVPYVHGSTNTAEALRTMHSSMFLDTNGDRLDVKNVGILITDGFSNINSRLTIPEANVARDHRIAIFAIGIGLQDTREIDGIANKPLDRFRFNVDDFSDLHGIDHKILSSICLG